MPYNLICQQAENPHFLKKHNSQHQQVLVLYTKEL